MIKKERVACLLLSLALMTASLLYSQAFSPPISDRVIVADITLPDGESAQVEVRDGTMVRVQDEERQYIYSFVFFLDSKSGRPSVIPFKISPLADGGEGADYLSDAKPLSGRQPTKIETESGGFVIRMLRVTSGYFPNVKPYDPRMKKLSPEELRKLYGKEAGSCCVTCDPVTVCATRVSMACGSCTGGGGSRLPV